MANIINNEADQSVKIEKFSFEKLDVDDADIVACNPFAKEEDPAGGETASEPTSQEHAQPNESGELLEKVDQLTSDVVRLQMELEKAQSEHLSALEAAKAEAYERGRQEAIETLQQETAEEIEALKSQFVQSITRLDEQQHALEQALQRLEEELLESAFVIAKKVILKEVEKDSSKIAANIAKYLLRQIEESSDVTLKVNPEDFDYISSQLKETLIKIESDQAIQKGGVVILGGEENIDGTILTRYRQALQFLQKES